MSRPTATDAAKRRWGRFPDVGCVACLSLGIHNPQTTAHHLLDGGRRVGHLATIPLCPWHHQGIPGDMGYTLARERLGPSMAREPREFEAWFGRDQTLLATTNAILERWGL